MMIHRTSILGIFVAMLVVLARGQSDNICSTKCKEGACTDASPLQCTGCHNQYILIDSACIPVGSQPEPIRYYHLISQTLLIDQSNTNRNKSQVICQWKYNPNQLTPNRMVFFNETISTTDIYYSETFFIRINPKHQYIQIRMNAILFNRRQTPNIKMLIINDQNADIFYELVNAQILDPAKKDLVTCTSNNQTKPASYPFYISKSISTSTSSISLQLITQRENDQLGISNFQVFYGNCHQSCQSCIGPSANQCLTCRNLLKYDQQNNKCSGCPNGFYQLIDTCNACPYNCQQCQYSETAGKPLCTSCITDLNSTNAPQCTIQNQIYRDFVTSSNSSSQGWSSNFFTGSVVSTCGRYPLFGGVSSGLGNSQISKTFTGLSVHDAIWIKFIFLAIDQELGSTYSGNILVDNKPYPFQFTQSGQNTSECGTNLKQFVYTVNVNDIPHQASSVKIVIVGKSNFFGFNSFVLGVKNMTNIKNCISIYDNKTCSQCSNGLKITNGVCSGCPSNYFLKDGVCEVCPVYCKQCQSFEKCISCNAPLIFDSNSSTCSDKDKKLYKLAVSPLVQTISMDGFNMYPKLQTKGKTKCGNQFIIGSDEIKYRNLTITKEFSGIPNHQGVYFHFRFYQIDDYGGLNSKYNDSDVTVSFKINGKKYPYSISRQGLPLCGNSTLDLKKTITLHDPSHTADKIILQIFANRVKFGINQIMLFVENCPQCANNIVQYEIQTISEYVLKQEDGDNFDKMKYKIIFNEEVSSLFNKTDDIFQVQTKVNTTVNNTVNQYLGQATGNLEQSNLLTNATLKKNRQIIGYKPEFRDQINWTYGVSPTSPEAIFSKVSSGGAKPIKIDQTEGYLPRFDNLNFVQDQTNMRNLRNFFRGIAVLGMWIGLISFFFGLSSAFDDLFVLTQLIFVHIFIQSQWLAASFKIPLSGMKFVQFMEWLPDAAKQGIEAGIIPSNHYQRSPIVYEQYYKDITFARTIYHVVLAIAIFFAFYLLIRVFRAFSKPTLGQMIENAQTFNRNKNKKQMIRDLYMYLANHPFVFIEKIVRFIFFTVVWACILQFTWFQNQPFPFFQWNAAICIIFFVVFVMYPIIGFIYLWRKSDISSSDTFNELYFGIRVRRQRLWYFIFKYLKLLAIALLIGLLFKVNPLACLIPLMVIHIADAVILLILKPYHLKENKQRILTFLSRHYWTYYRWSHIIQNILFLILELILIIMYGRRSLDDRPTYLGIGYAACAFVILLLINGLIRVAWNLIRIFQILYFDFQQKLVKIESDDNDEIPINQVRNRNPQTTRILYDRNNQRKPSIQQSMANQFAR